MLQVRHKTNFFIGYPQLKFIFSKLIEIFKENEFKLRITNKKVSLVSNLQHGLQLFIVWWSKFTKVKI